MRYSNYMRCWSVVRVLFECLRFTNQAAVMKVWTVDEGTGPCSAPSIHGESHKLTRTLVALSSSAALYEKVLPQLGRV